MQVYGQSVLQAVPVSSNGAYGSGINMVMNSYFFDCFLQIIDIGIRKTYNESATQSKYARRGNDTLVKGVSSFSRTLGQRLCSNYGVLCQKEGIHFFGVPSGTHFLFLNHSTQFSKKLEVCYVQNRFI